jgi:8-oxo-dGTP pyrophosphatase MutT (NUDIX family)
VTVVATRPAWFDRLATLPEHPPQGAFARFGRRGSLPGVEDVQGALEERVVRRSAVLMLFADDPARLLLTRRAQTLRSHAGQVALPGGGIDQDDAGPEAAALREAVEETGLDPLGVEVIGALPTVHLHVTGWDVTPVLAWWAQPSPVRVVDPAEVGAVVAVELEELLDPANRFSVMHPTGLVGPGFRANGLFIWGFTAMLVSEVLALGGLERPWDPTRTEVVP